MTLLGLASLSAACAEVDDATLEAAGQPLVDDTLEVAWVAQFGSLNIDVANDVVAAPGERVFAAGTTLGALPGQPHQGHIDAFVQLTDAAGVALWTRQFGSAARDTASAVASAGADALYVAGDTDAALPGQQHAGGRDAFVRRYDARGGEVWTVQFGSALDDEASAVAASAGAVYVAGFTHRALGTHPAFGARDAYLRKLDAAGTPLWTRQLGSGGDDVATGVALGDDAVYVVGRTAGALSGQQSAGDSDAFVRAYDLRGDVLWTVQFGSRGADGATGVAFDGARLYVTGVTAAALPGGRSAGGRDAFVRAFGVDGQAIWTQQFGSAASDSASGVDVSAGVVSVVGTTRGALRGRGGGGGIDAFVQRLDAASGRLGGLRGLGTSKSDMATGIAVVGLRTWVSGSTDGHFPDETGAHLRDAFVAALDEVSGRAP